MGCMQNEDVNPESLSVYPTLVVTGEEIVCTLNEQTCAVVRVLRKLLHVSSICIGFDVQFPAEIVNTCNFLDVYTGRMDKKGKIRSSVQRKINMLMAALYSYF